MWFRGAIIAAALATAIQAPPIQAAPAAVAAPADTVTVGTGKYGIALMPGAVFTTNARGEWWEPYVIGDLVRNSLSGTGTTMVAGPPQTIGPAATNKVSASAHRLMNDGLVRYGIGAPKRIDAVVDKLSGTRAAVIPPRAMHQWHVVYDVRTGALEDRNGSPSPWWQGEVDVFGNYLVYSVDSATGTQIRRRDLATRADVLVQRVGGHGVNVVAVNGNLVAWVTRCVGQGCTQVVGYRVVSGSGALGPVRSFATAGTYTLDLSATHLALDAYRGRRELRLVTLGSHTVRVIGNPTNASGTTHQNPPDYPGYTPVHFDLDNDRIAWLDADQNAKVTAVGTPPARARYLGNGLIMPWFTPNGDGKYDTFGASLPFSKSLTRCTVTFRRGTTAVRTAPCLVRNGDVLITWNGRDSAGRLVPKGRYQWTLTGSDPAGAVLWYTGSGAPIRATVEVR